MGIDGKAYLDRPAEWEELALRLRAAGTVAIDSEYHGWDSLTGTPCPVNDGKSPVGRTRIHVFSVAVPSTPTRLDALGYRRTVGWCLPAAALSHPALVAVLEDASIRKAVHNQSVDQHALANHGITLRGGINTLGLVRWVMPWLINQPGRFKLKALMSSLLRREPIATFLDVVSYERQVTVSKWKKVTTKHCECGEPGCRLRKGHEKYTVEEDVEVLREKTERGKYGLWEIVPGHERWGLLVQYAIDDSLAALNLLDLCEAVDTDPAPWPYGGERPGFNQALEESIIEMEMVGIPVDVPWCRETATTALEMEEATLKKLHTWFVRNAPTHGPHRRDEVDAVWGSGVKKIALFDRLCFPRSPVWKKGRVKRDKWCLDGVAMDWIANHHPPAKQIADLLLHLQRIRSGKKYLEKLRDSGGMVHPTCGPSGDDDDRAGAVTGRLGIKGELEAAQLPKEGEKDLFGIRKAIIANPNALNL